jgi:hypothetical protein
MTSGSNIVILVLCTRSCLALLKPSLSGVGACVTRAALNDAGDNLNLNLNAYHLGRR